MTKGTPKTLLEACENALESADEANALESAETARKVVREFIVQKFTWAFANAKADEAELLKGLWFKITGEYL